MPPQNLIFHPRLPRLRAANAQQRQLHEAGTALTRHVFIVIVESAANIAHSMPESLNDEA